MKRFNTKVGYLNGDTVKSITDCGTYVSLTDEEGNFAFNVFDAVSVVGMADLDTLIAERDELRDRVRAAENAAVEQGAILDWIDAVLDGKQASDFAESFPLVRAVQDLYMERDVLRRLDRENLELRKRLTVWCDAIINAQLCTKAACHRLARGDREVWVCETHREEAGAWQTQPGADPADVHTLPFKQAPGSLIEWPGPEPRTLP